MPPLQCLFCNHLNPGGASFCNDCGSQLHLQPCDRCGAIDKRTARNCYKCGASFTLPAASDIDSTPPLPDNQIAAPALIDFGLPELRPPDEPQQPVEILLSEGYPPASRSRRTWRMAAAVLLFAAIAIVVFYYSERSAQLAWMQRETQPDPSLPRAPTAAGATPSTVAAPVEAASAPTDTTSQPGPGTAQHDEARLPSPSAAAASMPVRPSSALDGAVKTRQDPPLFKECSPAVEALGFCSSGTKQETQ